MRKLSRVGLAVTLALAMWSGAAAAQQAVPNYAHIKPELDMLAGALSKTGTSTVLFTYVPGEGATFVMTVNPGATRESLADAFTRVAGFFVPSVSSVPDSERFTFAARYDLLSEWELILTLTKADAGNPDAWTWYYSQGQ